MSEGKQEQAWAHTSSLMSLIHNVNCSKTSQMKKPSFFDPTSKKVKKRLSKKETTAVLKDFLSSVTNGMFQEKTVKYKKDGQGRFVLDESE